MEQTITEKKERYIDQACHIEIGEEPESNWDEATEKIRFWQSLTSEDRIQATSEIVRRVHLARGGKPEVFRIDKPFTRKGRIEDKNEPYS